MLASTSFQDKVTEFRRLMTRPKPTSTSEARARFLRYLKDKHHISDIDSEAGKNMLENLKRWPATKAILESMNY